MSWITMSLALTGTFFVSDLVYAADHYFVHHDRARYSATHSRHHRRYNVAKNGPQLDAYELTTYGTAALMSVAGTSVLSLMTGNFGFLLGAVLKFVHTLLFHCYQHHWWGKVHLRKQRLGAPKAGWGIASARYHAYHHSNPDDLPFTYAESWEGFDRLLELAHPWLARYTADGAHASVQRRAVAGAAPGRDAADARATPLPRRAS